MTASNQDSRPLSRSGPYDRAPAAKQVWTSSLYLTGSTARGETARPTRSDSFGISKYLSVVPGQSNVYRHIPYKNNLWPRTGLNI